MRRISLILIIVAAVVLLVMPVARVYAAVFIIAAAIAAGVAPPTPAASVPVAQTAAEVGGATPTPKPKRPQTVLVANVHAAANTPDLQRILAGIVGDERGKVVSANGGPLVATFASAAGAIHAAQRIVSNVDALGRRLDRFIGLTMGIDDSVEDATKLEEMTHEKRIAVLVSSAAATAADSTSLAEVEPGFFSFIPVQQRLF